MAKSNPHAKGDAAKQLSGGILTQGVNVRKPGRIGVSDNVPAGSEGTNSGPGRKGQGR